MTLIVTSTNEKTIALPQWLMRQLNLHDGDQIKPIIDGGSIRLTPLDQFLSLRGILKDDSDFDQAIESLNQRWQSWKLPESA
jgi:antitoxin component of MazEF toxin-antitoxin module